MAADFESSMKDVQTLMGKDSTDKVAQLGDAVKRISMDTGKDLDNVAGGLYEVISAFGDTADAAKQLEIATKAAMGGKAETIDAVKLLSSVTKGYGDTSSEAVQKVADLAFQTANLGQTTFPELAATMGRVTPMAATMGIKMEELFGSMATLTGVTGNTAEVTTQLRATIQALLNPSTQMAEAMNSLGYSSGQAMIQALGMQGTLTALAQSTDGNTAQLAKMFGSVDALNAVLALTGAQAADFTTKTEAMYNATGASTQAFEIQQQSVNAMMGRLQQMAQVAMVELGEKFLPVLMSLAEWIMANMPAIQGFFETTFDAIGKAVNWVSENVLPMFKGAFEDSSGTASAAMQFFHDKVVPILSKVWEVIQKFVEAVQLIWAEWGDEIMSIVGTAFDTIASVIDGVLQVIGGILDVFIGLFTGNWERMKEGLIEIWNGLWQSISSIITGAWEILSTAFGGLWEAIAGWFTGLYNSALEWGSNMMKGFWDGITGWFSRIWDGVTEFVSNVTDKVKGVLGIHSPSTVFAEIGMNIGKGLALGIEGTEVDVNRALSIVVPNIGDTRFSAQSQVVATAHSANPSLALDEAIARVAHLFPDKLEAEFVLPDGTIQRSVLNIFKKSGLTQAVHAR